MCIYIYAVRPSISCEDNNNNNNNNINTTTNATNNQIMIMKASCTGGSDKK